MPTNEDATLTERFPVVISGAIGLALSQSVNVVQQFCHCFTADQLAAVNNFVGSVIAVAVIIWQYKNVWSKASVERVAASPTIMTLKQAEEMVSKP